MASDQTPDVPIPPAELARWDATLTAVEETDLAAGRTDPAIALARAAFGRASGRRS